MTLMEMQIKAQIEEVLTINKLLRQENARLRNLIAASKLTRMTLVNGGVKEDKNGNDDEGPGDNAS